MRYRTYLNGKHPSLTINRNMPLVALHKSRSVLTRLRLPSLAIDTFQLIVELGNGQTLMNTL